MARDKAKPVTDHVQELISRLRIIVIVLVLTTVIAFPYSGQFLNFLQKNLLPSEWKLIVTSPVEAVTVELLISFIIGVIVSFPIILYQIVKFVGPALMPKERSFVSCFILGFLGLFVFGMLFAYYLLLPMTYRILVYLAQPTGASALISLENFVS
jgi:sec-independent protein translocase protein TatC